MTTGDVGRIAALGAITGARSMAGLTTVALGSRNRYAPLAALLWLAETVADKSPVIGNRTELAPLAARAVLGAVVGGSAAREAGASMAAGALVGGATAVIAAHLAMRARQRLPLSQLAGGIVEDLIVGTVAACCIGATPERSTRGRS
jgi:hypothetical protein